MITNNTLLVRDNDKTRWRKVRSMDKLDELEKSHFGAIMEHVNYCVMIHKWDLESTMNTLFEPSIIEEYFRKTSKKNTQ